MGSEAAGSGPGLAGVLKDHWPFDVVQSSRPTPANEFVPLPPASRAVPPPPPPPPAVNASGNGTNSSGSPAPEPGPGGLPLPPSGSGGSGKGERVDLEGGAGLWDRLWVDFRREERQLELYPCRGGCAGGVYSATEPSGRGDPQRPWGPGGVPVSES